MNLIKFNCFLNKSSPQDIDEAIKNKINASLKPYRYEINNVKIKK